MPSRLKSKQSRKDGVEKIRKSEFENEKKRSFRMDGHLYRKVLIDFEPPVSKIN